MARFLRTYPPAVPPAGPALVLRFAKGELLLSPEGFMPGELPPVEGVTRLYLGDLDGVPCFAEALPDSVPLPDGARSIGLRSLYGTVDEAHYALVGYALPLLRWQKTGRFCSVCATEMTDLPNTWGRECPNCGHSAYPPVSPAVLALVHDGGDRVLLAQKEGWGNRYSILAGFVEPGESLEECAMREVLEEVGAVVESPQYQGSQTWPFPHQVMIGFTCQYVSGDLVLDETELSHAAWFHHESLPELPPSLSLSRQNH